MKMTEFKKQIPKEGFQSANAKFLGYADEPMEGEKDGNKWRKAKVNFHIEKKQNPNKFIVWSPIKAKDSIYTSDTELKQFQMYNIVWVEEAKEFKGKEWVEKRIVIIRNYDADKSKQQPQTSTNSINSVKQDDAFQGAMVDYLNAIRPIIQKNPEEAKNLKVGTRMLGSILIKAHPDTFKPLLKLCDEALENFKV
jgi:hypothetical protein